MSEEKNGGKKREQIEKERKIGIGAIAAIAFSVAGTVATVILKSGNSKSTIGKIGPYELSKKKK